jgi:purine-cytosine permease-like protein
MNDPATQPPDINASDDERRSASPSTRAQVIFWSSLVYGVTVAYLGSYIEPTGESMINFFFALTCIAAINFAAFYPVRRKELRSNIKIFIAWIGSILVALVIDLSFCWGLIR